MKKFLFAASALAALITTGCRKLDVEVESQYVQANFPKTPADFSAVIGPLYTQLSSRYGVDYFRMQTLPTDEAIIPARDGNWDDGGQYRQHHHHTWTADHANVTGIWQWGFGGINTCNRLVSLFNSAAESEAKTAALAEVKAMRALFYFYMMDTYGNVPLIDTFPVNKLPGITPRAQIFDFIEKEVKAILPQLPAKTAANTTAVYGKPTKGMGFALLQKLYMNAEVYTGKPRWNEAVAMADSIIASNAYSLDGNYTAMFMPDNGPQIKEFIFAIPYDALLIPGQQFTRMGFLWLLAPKYGVPNNLSIAMSTTPEFYDRFSLPGDVRNTTWLVGKQVNNDGSPLYSKDLGINMTTKTLDRFYPGPDKDTLWQVEITKQLVMVGPKPFDIGNDFKARCAGVRSIKFYPDKNSIAASRLNGNDMPVFRLADVLLMKAEALLRGATPTTVNGVTHTPLDLLNMVRTRSGAPAANAIDMQVLLDERARELYWECWRRNDLIRFGQFEVEYPIPGDVLTMNKDIRRRIFPIPNTELKLNPNLVQNPGY